MLQIKTDYLSYISLAFILLICSFENLQSQNNLPVGPNPAALEFNHFPNRMFAFVWRNWNLATPARMGEVIGCSEEQILEIASLMGLNAPMSIPAEYKRQMYITVLKRNWHLLPYEQLMVLLDMSESELAFALKEDDFLFVKLGNLKPHCAPIEFVPPDEPVIKWAKDFRQLVQSHFKDINEPPAERKFHFIKALSEKPQKQIQEELPNEDIAGLRYIYSYFGIFGDPLMDEELSAYPEGLLHRLAAQGVNGIWMHVVLNQLVPEGGVFPEFGAGSKERILNLKKLVDRARKYNIKVYLYMNEPRAMPYEFFDYRKAIAGAKKEGFQAMCTSTDMVINWLTSSLTHVFTEVPGLGGVFTITASENFTNCASKGEENDCPRCSKRNYAEVIANVNKAIAKGVHKGSPEAKVIVWDWGWNGHGDGSEIIKKLPDDVWFMSVSEWAKPFSRGGVESAVGEYSISVVGPGPRAKRHWALASDRGLNTVAKVQFNNTWEFSAVPWMPTLDLVAQHAYNLTKSGVDGYMLSWSLGGYPSPNLEVVHKFSKNPDLTVESTLDEIASERYGSEAAPYARKAWTAFSHAFVEFPYGGGVVYRAPQQYGPANLYYVSPTGYASTMVGFPYDDLDGWRGPYTRINFAAQFEKIARGWTEGLRFFDQMLEMIDPECREVALADYRIAKAVYLHFASVANQCNYIIKRDFILQNPDYPERKGVVRDIKNLLTEEIRLAKDLYEISRADSRIGFEASNQYYYVPQDLVEKVINCTYLLSELKDQVE